MNDEPERTCKEIVVADFEVSFAWRYEPKPRHTSVKIVGLWAQI
jgi:hypothetical protein